MQYQYPSNQIWTSTFILVLGLLSACTEKPAYLFQEVDPQYSGVDFVNTITETEDFNILNFHYIYNGGGVGVADFNKDNLPDLVFTGNQVSSQIYLNKGNLKFSDISEPSGFGTEAWATGISIVDLNADTWPDIYISVGGINCQDNCNNQLFIHQGLDENGIPVFKEMAAEYGLDDGLYTQQAAFVDFDLDGDLDVYLLHNVTDQRDKNAPSKKHFISEKSQDYLFRNDSQYDFSNPEQVSIQALFTNVSDSMGIKHRGYGLGIVVDDFNQDLLPDLYIANDFLSDDLLYINQGIKDGIHQGYKESSKKYLKHTSYNAMGVDVADVNQDALPDIFVLDMMPEYNERQKTMIGFMNYDKFQLSLRQGYQAQFVRNTLQINNGSLKDDLLPFSEVGHLTGTYNTDWSWTPLLADFDNDGDRDLFVSNGYGKDITDLDFTNYSQNRSPFGTKESQDKWLFDIVQQMESITLPNYIFENQGALQFSNQQGNWIDKKNTISNGAIYADLDADGDLDLVVNNIGDPAFILENQTNETSENNFFEVEIIGDALNKQGIGTIIKLWSGGIVQRHYHNPVRGYLSSVQAKAQFGIGTSQLIDSLEVLFPSKDLQSSEMRSQKFYNIPIDKTFKVTINELEEVDNKAIKNNPRQLLLEEDKSFQLSHSENPWQDYDAQPLLLNQLSKQGPCLLAAELDGQEGDEIFIGGAKGFPSQLLFTEKDGKTNIYEFPNEGYEDTDAAFFDFDQDGDLDLYIASGGTEFLADPTGMTDRLYINDGNGNFDGLIIDLPQGSASCVRPFDFDQDGDIDLFVGSRVVPGAYPQSPVSYLLINEGDQSFSVSPFPIADGEIGMVTDACWTDYDQDGWTDLLLVGEWMSITIFKNNKGTFGEEPIEIPESRGWWNSIGKGDLDGDGDEDFVLGNLGENARLKASLENPLYLYTGDLDNNGSQDPFIGQFYLNKKGEKICYPVHARDDIVRQVTGIKKQYVTYAEFGQASFWDVLAKQPKSDFLLANYLKSAVLMNEGAGNWKLQALPQAAQFAPIQDLLLRDLDGDGYLDLIATGNNYTSEKNNGWYDASNGLVLKGQDNGQFLSIPNRESGFFLPGDGRQLIFAKGHQGGEYIIAGQNSLGVKRFQLRKKAPFEQLSALKQ